MKVHDAPAFFRPLIAVTLPPVRRDRLAIREFRGESPIEYGPGCVAGDPYRDVARLKLSLGESLLQKIHVETVADAVPALKPAEGRDDENVRLLQPHLRSELCVGGPDRLQVF